MYRSGSTKRLDKIQLQDEDAAQGLRRLGGVGGGKLHAVCDGDGRPLVMLLSEGQVRDF